MGIFNRPCGTLQGNACLMFPDMNIGAIFGCLYQTNSFGLDEKYPAGINDNSPAIHRGD
jgi:hypothetical protein